ncbi:MAG: hypothetical protein SWH68_10940 [Thermodesulfobacteriota bacterium]|nr:hypothetical protein [Thermodesulfobacteriota bacterium]
MKKASLLMLNTGIMVLVLSGFVFAQHGMMSGDYGTGMPQRDYQSTRQSGEPVDKEKAKAILEDYLNTLGSGELKPGEITDQGMFFVAEIVTRDGDFVNRMQINKRTGRIYHYGYGYQGYGRRGDPYGSERSGNWNYCPYCGREYHQRGYGPGMMRGYGPGMMHRGYGPGMMRGYGPGMMMPGYERYQDSRESGEPMDNDTARQMVSDYLSANDNPNLKIGEIKEKEAVFEVKIVTQKSEDIVDIIEVDRYSGYMRSIYQ